MERSSFGGKSCSLCLAEKTAMAMDTFKLSYFCTSQNTVSVQLDVGADSGAMSCLCCLQLFMSSPHDEVLKIMKFSCKMYK